MDDAERAWLREKLYEHAAELGGQKARQQATDDDLRNVRNEVRELGVALKNELASHYNHLRGEIATLKDEERRRMERLLQQLDDREADREEKVQRAWRMAVLIGGAIIVGGQQLFEHLPALLSWLSP